MTLLLMEGFDHYSTAQMYEKFFDLVSSNSISSAYARFSGQGCQCNTHVSYFSLDLGVNKSTIYFGTAFKKVEGGAPSISSTYPIIRFEDESGVYQVALHINSVLGIVVYQGDTTLLGGSADGVVPNLRWCYIEAKVTISDTVGVVEVRINEVEVINETGLDTKNGSDYIRKIRCRGIYNGIDDTWDDIYVDDSQFHGDCRIRTFMPGVDGNSADFTRSTGSNDYECVDEIPSNDDSDYIVSDTLNHKSIFGITTGALGTVKGIQVNNHVRIDEAGIRKIKPVIRSNSTDYQGTESPEITADYKFESEVWELDPDDSGAWTQTKLEAAEFGLEITT